MSEFLQHIHSPDDLRKLKPEDLAVLAKELRQFILEATREKKEHIRSGFGVVELTIALHYVYQTPHDRLIWDVGHQAYAHKVLTGRREQFHTNRQHKGISGFPKREESVYDTFGTGHSSTSLSALLGMLVADGQRAKAERQYIAVIGDGALTSGMAYEALNHAGASGANMLIVLNDNGISIDENVGALHQSGTYQTFFEALQADYHGPVDGHDIPALLQSLETLKKQKGLRVLHIKTEKGKGYTIGERETIPSVKKTSYQDVFGQTLLELAQQNPNIVAVTPAMLSGSSMKAMQEAFPERTFDVGIAEQHAVTFSAGLAVQGMIPFCHIYSTFMQRAYDQLIHDVALQKLPVIFCLDRAGLAGADGATHHGVFDLAFLRCIPHLTIAAPMDEAELRNLMYTAQHHPKGPFVIRYPKSNTTGMDWKKAFEAFPPGRGRCIKKGKELAMLSIGTIGTMISEALLELEDIGIQAAHYDLRFAKPLDEALLHEVFQQFSYVITVEDACITGGIGEAVMTFASQQGYTASITQMGIPDYFVEQGSIDELRKECGFDKESIETTIKRLHAEAKQ